MSVKKNWVQNTQETYKLLIFEIRVARKITNTWNYNPVNEFKYLHIIALRISTGES